jgi:hypothetical protein
VAIGLGHENVSWDLILAGANLCNHNFINTIPTSPGREDRFVEEGLKRLSDAYEVLIDSQESINAIHFKNFSIIILFLLENQSIFPAELRARVKEDIETKLQEKLPKKWAQTFLKCLKTKFSMASSSTPEELIAIQKEAKTLLQAIQFFTTSISLFTEPLRPYYVSNFGLLQVQCSNFMTSLTLTNSESSSMASSSTSIIEPETSYASSQPSSTQPIKAPLIRAPNASSSSGGGSASESSGLANASMSRSGSALLPGSRSINSQGSQHTPTNDKRPLSAVPHKEDPTSTKKARRKDS